MTQKLFLFSRDYVQLNPRSESQDIGQQPPKSSIARTVVLRGSICLVGPPQFYFFLAAALRANPMCPGSFGSVGRLPRSPSTKFHRVCREPCVLTHSHASVQV